MQEFFSILAFSIFVLLPFVLLLYLVFKLIRKQ